MKKENTAIRLKKIMSDRNLRQVDILNLTEPYCKKYDVKMNKSDISQYCSGKTEPNQDKLFILGIALNVSEAWLMGYDVPMKRNEFRDAPTESHKPFDNIEDFKRAYDKSNLRKNTLESKILDNVGKLNNDGKKSLLDYSTILLGNPNFTNNNSDVPTVQAAHNDFADDKEQQQLMKEDLDEL